MSRPRGADDHAVCIVGIVVVPVAAVVHIVEIVIVISGAEPPPRGARRAQKLTYARTVSHQVLIALPVPFHGSLDQAYLPVDDIHPKLHRIRLYAEQFSSELNV